MKLRCFLLTLAITVCLVNSVEAEPRIEVDQKGWHFGTVAQGAVEKKTFELRNAGTSRLIIKSISGCCGYSVDSLSSWMLLPGGVSQVTVICDATKKTPGPNEKAIKIISNDAVKPTFEIKVGADIVEKITKKRLHSVPRVYEEEDLVPYVTSSQLISFMSEGKTIEILDVRERSEYSLKHIHNAINFPRSELVYGQGDMLNVLKTLNKKATIAVHCGGGIRSSYIARRLREYGFDAYNLEGGLKAWENMGYPLVEGPKLPPSKEPLFISLEEAYDHYFVMFKEKTIWIDVRDSNEYNKGHIKNAINIPLDTLKQNISVIPTDKEIVLYCDGRDCDAAIAAGRLLVADGSFKQPKIKVLLEGFDGWKQAKYSIEE